MGGNLIDKTNVYAKWHGGFVNSKIQQFSNSDSELRDDQSCS